MRFILRMLCLVVYIATFYIESYKFARLQLSRYCPSTLTKIYASNRTSSSITFSSGTSRQRRIRTRTNRKQLLRNKTNAQTSISDHINDGARNYQRVGKVEHVSYSTDITEKNYLASFIAPQPSQYTESKLQKVVATG